MTDEIVLKVQKRSEKEKAAKLREKGQVPGVLYGPKTKTAAVFFDKGQIGFIEKEAGKATISKLQLEGEKKTRNVIIQDLQHDKLTDKLLHVDFYEVDMTQEIETEVPLEFKGISAAVKDLGGVFLKNEEEIQVKCLPAKLPEKIEVDISPLKTFEDVIYVKDLVIPEGVEVLNGADEVVAMVSKPRSEKEIEELDEAVEEDVTGVEGVEDKEGKEEGEKEEEEGKEAASEEKAEEGEKSEAAGEKPAEKKEG